MKNFFFFLLGIISSFSISAQTLSGYITDKGSGEGLPNATVFDPVQNIGVTSNIYGFFSIDLVDSSSSLIISYVGYSPQTLDLSTIEITDDPIKILLAESSQDLESVTVTAQRSIVEQTQMSMVEVPIADIKQIPALMGEVDVIKALQLLPGVQSGSEGTSGLYVRGGGPDQNLILLDGVPVYNASHLFGFFSVFNADAIKSVRLTKGGFPARFGGRLSSVLEIDLKEGNLNEYHGDVSIGLLSSKVTVEGPIKKDVASFMVSARRTYIDALIQPFLLSNDVRAGYFFQDINIKGNVILSPKDRLYVSLYTGKDKFYSRYKERNQGSSNFSKAGLDWGNITSSVRWNHQFTSKIFGNLTATFTDYTFDINLENEVDGPGTDNDSYFKAQYISRIRDYGLKYDLDWNLNNNHLIRLGGQIVHHRFQPGAIEFDVKDQTTDLDSIIEINEPIQSLDLALYIEDDWRVSSRLKLNPGLRLTSYFVNDIQYTALEPRFNSNFAITDRISFKASYAYMRQYLHLLTNSGLGLPTDLWVSATENVPPQTSNQVATGFAFDLLQGKLEFSVEGYYKTMDGLIEYLPGSGFASNADWQSKIASGGSGISKGIELFLQKKNGNTTGWIGYTLSKTTRQFDNKEINNGNEYPYKYDRRHDISIVLNQKINDRVDIGATWVYGTGNALTITNGSLQNPFQIDDNGIPTYQQYSYDDFGERNSYRVPAYHRFDIGVNFRKKKPRGIRTWNISVYNAYSRQNVFYVEPRYAFPNNADPVLELYGYSLFPIIPSFTWSFKF